MVINTRSGGVLLHISSLPSPFGVGDLGPWAYRSADLLPESNQRYWQVLPLTPTSLDCGNSPYTSDSAFAGNPLLISPELLEEEGLLEYGLLASFPKMISDRVDYEAVASFKGEVIKKAYKGFKTNVQDYRSSFEVFCEDNADWLNDYALYKALRETIGEPWNLWPAPLRDKEKDAVEEKTRILKEIIEFEKFVQFVFYKQWYSLKRYCGKKGLHIIGDLSFYVSYDSTDVWTHPEIFKLGSAKKPLFVAGVPPDYFSSTGQLWGNPVYDWDRLAGTQFAWWMNRIEHSLKLFDLLRLDHFRGFLAYWEILAGQKTAEKGSWVETPSEDFFKTLAGRFPNLPFIAEDLGVITDDVKVSMNRLGIPGMKVLLFAFDDDNDDNNMNNPYILHNHVPNSVVFTGTHDTNTVRGWFTQDATSEEKRNFLRYIGKELSDEDVSWELIGLAVKSVSNLSMIPMQDILSLGAEARMNHPAKMKGNWQWRVTQEQMESDALKRLSELSTTSGRQ